MGAAFKHLLINGSTSSVSLIEFLSSLRIAVRFPISAARKISAFVFNEAHDIAKGIAQEEANLMGKLPFQTEAFEKLPQKVTEAV